MSTARQIWRAFIDTEIEVYYHIGVISTLFALTGGHDTLAFASTTLTFAVYLLAILPEAE